jgi:hypothetical protein
MKKIITTTLFLSTVYLLSSFALAEKATSYNTKVTVRIDRLRAISTDACNGKMDFKGKITIIKAIKNFPVMEGNNITPGWEFTTTTINKGINIKIDISDDDDALCGGGDDVVIVDPTGAQTILIYIDPRYPGTKTTTVLGKKISGKEQAEITYTTTMVAL